MKFKKILTVLAVIVIIIVGFYGYIFFSFVNTTTKVSKEVGKQIIEWEKADVNVSDSLLMILEQYANTLENDTVNNNSKDSLDHN